ncbi:MAG: site-2 protease family protein [Planctomycetaceae bacterium]|nr:site-2 protease family protein [Planctomycetaceae bacterium]
MSDDPQQPMDSERQPHPVTDATSAVQKLEVQRIDNQEGRFFPRPPEPRPPKRRLALILFLLTCVSTIYAGYHMFKPKFWIDPATGQRFVLVEVDWATRRAYIINGLTYAVAVMTILGAHEMGHYLQARRYGVPASLPMFIPMPIGPFGTMGAVIVQERGAGDRKAMFDIAISGPLAGLAVALPLTWWGIHQSRIGEIIPNSDVWTNPMIVEWMVGWIKVPLKPGYDIALNPILFAGWVGIFITGLNLIPIGQLDGGHILYCLVGKRAHLIARAIYLGAIAFVVFKVLGGNEEYSAWTLMLILVGMMGTRHPPTADDHVPLGATRIVLGWLTLAFIVIGFVPTPMSQSAGPPKPAQPIQRPLEKPVQDVRVTVVADGIFPDPRPLNHAF